MYTTTASGIAPEYVDFSSGDMRPAFNARFNKLRPGLLAYLAFLSQVLLKHGNGSGQN